MNTEIIINICVAIVAYLIGGISPAILIAKIKGKNILKEGSGNAGATNAIRVLGPKLGLLIFVLDLAKGAIVTYLALLFFGDLNEYIASVFVVVGHIFSIYYKFHAGKGVASSIGSILVVDWRLALICFAFGIILVLITKRVSIGSICSAIILPVATWFLCEPYFLFSLILACLIILKHIPNIKRLVNGQEKALDILLKKKDNISS